MGSQVRETTAPMGLFAFALHAAKRTQSHRVIGRVRSELYSCSRSWTRMAETCDGAYAPRRNLGASSGDGKAEFSEGPKPSAGSRPSPGRVREFRARVARGPGQHPARSGRGGPRRIRSVSPPADALRRSNRSRRRRDRPKNRSHAPRQRGRDRPERWVGSQRWSRPALNGPAMRGLPQDSGDGRSRRPVQAGSPFPVRDSPSRNQSFVRDGPRR